ncbi:MAG: ribonucleotide reductase N-terminal alpha domain-containing protein, partial [Smithellaceae bacterium]
METPAADHRLPALSRNALTVLERRYLKRDREGKILETPARMFRRVADSIAAAEKIFSAKADIPKLADQFYQMMAALEFLP